MKTSLIYLFTLAPFFGANAQEFVSYANCQPEDYVLVEATEVSINSQGRDYSPKCLKVRPGTVVTISASSHHPLQAAEDFEVVNPFASEESHIENQSRELTDIGFYGYFCTRHANGETGIGMAGAILVSND